MTIDTERSQLAKFDQFRSGRINSISINDSCSIVSTGLMAAAKPTVRLLPLSKGAWLESYQLTLLRLASFLPAHAQLQVFQLQVARLQVARLLLRLFNLAASSDSGARSSRGALCLFPAVDFSPCGLGVPPLRLPISIDAAPVPLIAVALDENIVFKYTRSFHVSMVGGELLEASKSSNARAVTSSSRCNASPMP